MVKVDIIIPVYNEEEGLEISIEKLLNFLKKTKFPYSYKIIIADNASIDGTGKIAKKLEKKHSLVKYVRINRKGRGFALKQVWFQSNADVVSYMDVDLSTDLVYFRRLIDELIINKNQLAVGNRLGKNSKVIGRSMLREVLSRGYNLLLQLIFLIPIKDCQCGFKAMDTKSFKKLVSEIKNNNWFFDSELILLALKNKMKVIPIDVKWKDDPGTSVSLFNTAWEDICGIARMKKKFLIEYFKQ